MHDRVWRLLSYAPTDAFREVHHPLDAELVRADVQVPQVREERDARCQGERATPRHVGGANAQARQPSQLCQAGRELFRVELAHATPREVERRQRGHVVQRGDDARVAGRRHEVVVQMQRPEVLQVSGEVQLLRRVAVEVADGEKEVTQRRQRPDPLREGDVVLPSLADGIARHRDLETLQLRNKGNFRSSL